MPQGLSVGKAMVGRRGIGTVQARLSGKQAGEGQNQGESMEDGESAAEVAGLGEEKRVLAAICRGTVWKLVKYQRDDEDPGWRRRHRATPMVKNCGHWLIAIFLPRLLGTGA